MGEATDHLEVKLAKVWVPPHKRMQNGELVDVEGHFREQEPADFLIVVPQQNLPKDFKVPKDAAPSGVGEGGVKAAVKKPGTKNKRPSDAIDLKDQRSGNPPPLKMDPDAMDAALEAAGVKVGPNTRIKMRLRGKSGNYGVTSKLGPDEYRVVVTAINKPEYADRHLYVINNSLVHELRHVAQMQEGWGHGGKGVEFPGAGPGSTSMAHAKKHGYEDRENEAQWFGRLADHTDEKGVGPLEGKKKRQGKKVWGLVPA